MVGWVLTTKLCQAVQGFIPGKMRTHGARAGRLASPVFYTISFLRFQHSAGATPLLSLCLFYSPCYYTAPAAIPRLLPLTVNICYSQKQLAARFATQHGFCMYLGGGGEVADNELRLAWEMNWPTFWHWQRLSKTKFQVCERAVAKKSQNFAIPNFLHKSLN